MPDRLANDVRWLSDDLREGRRAGTAKALEVADFLATRCAALGLEPVGANGFFQEFEVPLAPRDGGRSTLGRVGGSAPAGAPDVVPLFCADRGDVRGPVRFASFGIDDPERGRTDFGGEDARASFAGAIVVVARGVPATPPPFTPPAPPAAPGAPGHAPAGNVTPGADWGSGGLVFQKVMHAKRRGAVGVVLLPSPHVPDEPLLAFESGGGARAGVPCVAIGWRAARAQFGDAVVDAWRAELLGTPGATRVEATGEYGLTADVWREKGPARNVLARLRGADPTRTIVVGAHYDHLGHGGEGSLAPGETGAIHNGADDNASGTAAVLEIARLLSAGPRPACNVVFALWSGEELGLLGSEHWAEDPTVPIGEVVANVNLDMVGRGADGPVQVLAAGTAEPFAAWLAEAGPKSGLALAVSTSGGMMGGSSDHATFVKRRIPALHLFTGLHADYHKPSDDADKFQAEPCARVVDLCVDLVGRLATSGRLTFVEPKADPAAKPGPRSFRAWFGSVPNYAFEGPGVKIDGTSPGSPAEHAGLLKGDVITGLGDVQVGGMGDLMYALQTYKPGDVVRVTYRRDGVDAELRVTLSTRGQQ